MHGQSPGCQKKGMWAEGKRDTGDEGKSDCWEKGGGAPAAVKCFSEVSRVQNTHTRISASHLQCCHCLLTAGTALLRSRRHTSQPGSLNKRVHPQCSSRAAVQQGFHISPHSPLPLPATERCPPGAQLGSVALWQIGNEGMRVGEAGGRLNSRHLTHGQTCRKASILEATVAQVTESGRGLLWIICGSLDGDTLQQNWCLKSPSKQCKSP